MSSVERPEASEELIVQNLESYEYRQKFSLASVRTKSSGFFVGWIISYYNSLPEEEKNKVGKTANAFHISEMEVDAPLAYYDRHKEVIDSWILINNPSANQSLAASEEIHSAKSVLESAKGKRDPIFERTVFQASK
jgi:hypothetical protein